MVGFSSSDQYGNNIYTIRWLLITYSAQLSTGNAWATKIDAGAPSEYGAIRALQKYMHEFHEDRDHAMCNIQNRSIPALHSSSHSFENYPIRTFRALVFSKAHSHAKCFSAKWQHDNGGAWLKL
jgi:hypothetical protein